MSRWLDRWRAAEARLGDVEPIVDLGDADAFWENPPSASLTPPPERAAADCGPEVLAEMIFPDPCRPGRTSADVMHEDLRLILLALGLGDHARPYSPHEVVHREILPAIEKLGEIPEETDRYHFDPDQAAGEVWADIPDAMTALCCDLPLIHGHCPNLAMADYVAPKRGRRHV